MTFNEFLADSTRAVDITETQDRSLCDSQASNTGQSCQLQYFVPGSVENVAPGLLEEPPAATADAFLTQDQQGYVFEFGSGSQQWQYSDSSDCHIYGASLAAWALCLQDDMNNTIQARE